MTSKNYLVSFAEKIDPKIYSIYDFRYFRSYEAATGYLELSGWIEGDDDTYTHRDNCDNIARVQSFRFMEDIVEEYNNETQG